MKRGTLIWLWVLLVWIAFGAQELYSKGYPKNISRTSLPADVVEFNGSITSVGVWGYGPTYAVYVETPYAYIGSGRVLQVLDISNPSSPVLVGEVTTPGVIVRMGKNKDYVFLGLLTRDDANDPGVVAVDVSDPTHPQVIPDSYFMSPFPRGIASVGQYIYVVSSSTLLIYDVSNIHNPVVVNQKNFTSMNLYDIEVAGNMAYLGEYSTPALLTLDISDATHPVVIDTMKLKNRPYNLGRTGNHLLVAERSTTIEVVDISLPASPVVIGDFQISGDVRDVAGKWPIVYVAATRGGVQVIDFTNPQSPQHVGTLNTYNNSAIGNGTVVLFLSGNKLFAGDRNCGVRIFDITTPQNPQYLYHFTTKSWAYDVYVEGETVYLSDGAYGLVLLDVSDPSHPREKQHFNPTNWGYSYGIEVNSDYIFIANDLQGIQIVDKTTLNQISHISTGATMFNLAVSDDGKFLFAPARHMGFRIYDISDIQNPVMRANLPTPSGSSFFDVVLHNQVAFLSDYFGQYFSVDISDPDHPILLDSIQTSKYGGNNVALKYPYLYVADGDSGIRILDVSDPSHMKLLNTLSFNGWGWYVGIQNNFLFVGTDFQKGLLIYDLTDPVYPKLIGYYRTVGDIYSTFLSGNYLYVASGWAGMDVLDITGVVGLKSSPPSVSQYFEVYPNFPNPFNGTTRITYRLAQAGWIELNIFNPLGQKVRTLVRKHQTAGFYEVNWDGKNASDQPVSSGVYLYQLKVNVGGREVFTQTRKMVFIQ